MKYTNGNSMNEKRILVKRSILMGEVYEWRKKHTNEKYTNEKNIQLKIIRIRATRMKNIKQMESTLMKITRRKWGYL